MGTTETVNDRNNGSNDDNVKMYNNSSSNYIDVKGNSIKSTEQLNPMVAVAEISPTTIAREVTVGIDHDAELAKKLQVEEEEAMLRDKYGDQREDYLELQQRILPPGIVETESVATSVIPVVQASAVADASPARNQRRQHRPSGYRPYKTPTDACIIH